MLDHEVLQVWMWDIYLIGAHLFHWDTPGRFTEWAWNTSNTPCWKGDAEGVDVILEMKRVWMCWSILHAFGFPKFSVCEQHASMLFISMNNSVESSDHQDHVLGRGSPWYLKWRRTTCRWTCLWLSYTECTETLLTVHSVFSAAHCRWSFQWFSWYCSSCFDSCCDSFPRTYNYWGSVRSREFSYTVCVRSREFSYTVCVRSREFSYTAVYD